MKKGLWSGVALLFPLLIAQAQEGEGPVFQNVSFEASFNAEGHIDLKWGTFVFPGEELFHWYELYKSPTHNFPAKSSGNQFYSHLAQNFHTDEFPQGGAFYQVCARTSEKLHCTASKKATVPSGYQYEIKPDPEQEALKNKKLAELREKREKKAQEEADKAYQDFLARQALRKALYLGHEIEALNLPEKTKKALDKWIERFTSKRFEGASLSLVDKRNRIESIEVAFVSVAKKRPEYWPLVSYIGLRLVEISEGLEK